MNPSLPPSNNSGILLKVLVGLQLMLAVGSYFFFHEAWPAASVSIALILALVFFSRERTHDERVEQLKLKAISYGIVFGLVVMTVVNILGKMLKGIASWPAFSGFDALIMVLLIALGLFHYWRWQDGRARS